MDFTLYQVDAFADDVFKGNPAAVLPLESWLPTDRLQAIALENNLSETAYFVPRADGAKGHYDLRWFTPGAEVELCGHATLASAYVLFEFLGETADTLTFHTRSGALIVTRGEAGLLSMDFPARALEEVSDTAVLATFSKALGQPVQNLLAFGEYCLFVLESEVQVRGVRYSGAIEDALASTPYWGLLITAAADEATSAYDFVSRFFAPAKGVPEDPVTGSAHCMLAPYWAERLGKPDVVGYQASARGGMVYCTMKDDRVALAGRVAPYLKGTISIPG